jgi:hypothetical protein
VAGVTRGWLVAQVAMFLAAPAVLVARERKGRPVVDDVRPTVRSLAVVEGSAAEPSGPADAAVRLEAELATQPRGIRPLELITGVAAASRPTSGEAPRDERTAGTPVLDRACRTFQWIERDGMRFEPLEWARRTDADRAGYAWGRAS